MEDKILYFQEILAPFRGFVWVEQILRLITHYSQDIHAIFLATLPDIILWIQFLPENPTWSLVISRNLQEIQGFSKEQIVDLLLPVFAHATMAEIAVVFPRTTGDFLGVLGHPMCTNIPSALEQCVVLIRQKVPALEPCPDCSSKSGVIAWLQKVRTNYPRTRIVPKIIK